MILCLGDGRLFSFHVSQVSDDAAVMGLTFRTSQPDSGDYVYRPDLSSGHGDLRVLMSCRHQDNKPGLPRNYDTASNVSAYSIHGYFAKAGRTYIRM